MLAGFIAQEPLIPPKRKPHTSEKSRGKPYKALHELEHDMYIVTVYARSIMCYEMTTVHAFPPKEITEKRVTECIAQSVYKHKKASTDAEYQGE